MQQPKPVGPEIGFHQNEKMRIDCFYVPIYGEKEIKRAVVDTLHMGRDNIFSQFLSTASSRCKDDINSWHGCLYGLNKGQGGRDFADRKGMYPDNM